MTEGPSGFLFEGVDSTVATARYEKPKRPGRGEVPVGLEKRPVTLFGLGICGDVAPRAVSVLCFWLSDDSDGELVTLPTVFGAPNFFKPVGGGLPVGRMRGRNLVDRSSICGDDFEGVGEAVPD